MGRLPEAPGERPKVAVGDSSTNLKLRETPDVTAVIHVREASRDAVAALLERLLATSPGGGRGAHYRVSPPAGAWTTVLEVHQPAEELPWVSDVGMALSRELDTCCLSLLVHRSSVLLYELADRGVSRDGYTSCPPALGEEPLTPEEVAAQRHSPRELERLLPAGADPGALACILDAGWWQAWDAGLMREEDADWTWEDPYRSEEDRLEDLGNLLRLHGASGGYPYARWRENPAPDWSGWVEVRGDA